MPATRTIAAEAAPAQAATRGVEAVEARLLAGATRVAGRHGYTHLTVRSVIAASGVARATFYRHFAHVDECAEDAYRLHAGQLVTDVRTSLTQTGDLSALTISLADLISERPDVAALLLNEGLAAGQALRVQRDLLVSRLAASVAPVVARQLRAQSYRSLEILVGGILRYVGAGLLAGWLPQAWASDVQIWMTSLLSGAVPPPGVRALHSARRRPAVPPALGNASPARDRIIAATPAVVHAVGFTPMTVTDLVRAAKVSRRMFYREFEGKTDAYIAAYESAFERVMSACAPAYFSASAWPERVRRGAQAFSRFFETEWSLGYLVFVERHAPGRAFASRVDDTQRAFTLFLTDGYQQSAGDSPIPRTVLDLTGMAIVELAYQAYRSGAPLAARAAQPLALYLALCPVMGAGAAMRVLGSTGNTWHVASQAGPG